MLLEELTAFRALTPSLRLRQLVSYAVEAGSGRNSLNALPNIADEDAFHRFAALHAGLSLRRGQVRSSRVGQQPGQPFIDSG